MVRKNQNFKTVRPMEKDVIVLNKGITTTQVETTLYTANEACTLVRLVGNIGVSNSGTGVEVLMAIVRVRANLGVQTLSFSDGGRLYQPEADVLWTHALQMPGITVEGGHFAIDVPVDVKGMRKLTKDDSIRFVLDASATAGNILGVITSFVKL